MKKLVFILSLSVIVCLFTGAPVDSQVEDNLTSHWQSLRSQSDTVSGSGNHCPICFGSWGSGQHTEYEYIILRCSECNVKWGNTRKALSAAMWYCFYSSISTNTQHKCFDCKYGDS